MSELSERIQRFENMTTADPDNEMAHFSLGSAYLEAERAAEAAKSLQRCIDLNPEMSKAYQLAGQAMIQAGWADQAVEILNHGYGVAAGKGDVMPRDAIAELLQSIGREPPAVDEATEAAAKEAQNSGTFLCTRSGRQGSQLPQPPMRGLLGQWIFQNISAQTWEAWIGQGTKVINELRLDFSREEDQNTYDHYMREYLGIDDDLFAKINSGEALATG